MELQKVLILDPRDKELRAPTFTNFAKICRVCLAELPAYKPSTKNIHDSVHQVIIKSLIETYSFTKLSSDTDLPQNVCPSCVAFLTEIHTFRSRCIVNEDLLCKVKANHEGDFNVLRALELGDTFNEADKMQALINQINESRLGIFKCKDCCQLFHTEGELLVHRREMQHSKTKRFPCPVCHMLQRHRHMKRHMQTHTNERPFGCSQCGFRFSSKPNLRRHERTKHMGKKKIVCELCGKLYANSASLYIHHRFMHGNTVTNNALEAGEGVEILHKCGACSKLCISEDQFLIHSRIHDRNFMCPHCDKLFHLRKSLELHIRTHPGEPSQKQDSERPEHLCRLQGDQIHKCSHCERQFHTEKMLAAHIRVHAGGIIYRCTKCGKNFNTLPAIKKHKQLHEEHPEGIDNIEEEEEMDLVIDQADHPDEMDDNCEEQEEVEQVNKTEEYPDAIDNNFEQEEKVEQMNDQETQPQDDVLDSSLKIEIKEEIIIENLDHVYYTIPNGNH